MLVTGQTKVLLRNPRDLRALHGLYETNYHRLRRLLVGVDPLRNEFRLVADDLAAMPVHVAVLERHRYTTQYRLTYLLERDGEVRAEPDIEVRLYHDAELAETYAVGQHDHVGLLAGINTDQDDVLDRRWNMNRLLNKWLEYLLDQGYRAI